MDYNNLKLDLAFKNAFKKQEESIDKTLDSAELLTKKEECEEINIDKKNELPIDEAMDELISIQILNKDLQNDIIYFNSYYENWIKLYELYISGMIPYETYCENLDILNKEHNYPPLIINYTFPNIEEINNTAINLVYSDFSNFSDERLINDKLINSFNSTALIC